MKKQYLLLCSLFCLFANAWGQNSLEQVLPLLQASQRTPQQTEQVLSLFRTAKDPNLVFAAGASLVRITPGTSAQPVLLSQIIRGADPLKTAFSAIILTAMGAAYEELTPLTQDILQTQDPILRAYGAGAYALLNPQDKTYTTDVVRLFIFDARFAQRAMNQLATDNKTLVQLLKKQLSSTDPQLRGAAAAWLGVLHTPQATQLLLKRSAKETDPTVQTQLATALAKNAEEALPTLAKKLKVSPAKPAATTYTLALGFMTGHSINTLKTTLLTGPENARINALRACAYMASVLSNPDGFAFSSDREFDAHLLKGLIAPISALAQNGSEAEKTYAQNALSQIEKLM